MAAQVIVYVDPDAAGGADGTSWADAYTALETGLSTEEKDISVGTGSDEQYSFWCRSSGGTADTIGVEITDVWNSDTTNFVEVKSVDFPGDGVLDTTKYNLFQNDTGVTALKITTPYARMTNIQARVVAANHAFQLAFFANATAGDIRYSGCLASGICSGTNVSAGFYNILGNADYWNCTATGFYSADQQPGDGSWTGFHSSNTSASSNWWNCVSYGNEEGFREGTGFPANVTSVNCVSGNNVNDFFGGNLTVSNCCSDDGDGANASGPEGGDWTNEFTDPANGDFTPLGGTGLSAAGANDPGSGLYSTDIIGNSYVIDAWYRGAYAGPAAPAGVGAMMFGSDF